MEAWDRPIWEGRSGGGKGHLKELSNPTGHEQSTRVQDTSAPSFCCSSSGGWRDEGAGVLGELGVLGVDRSAVQRRLCKGHYSVALESAWQAYGCSFTMEHRAILFKGLTKSITPPTSQMFFILLLNDEKRKPSQT